MKTLEALKCIDNGKKMRLIEWGNDYYIHKNNKGNIVWQDGLLYSISINFNDEWEEYKEMPKDVEYFVSILTNRDGKFFSCRGIYCTTCPLRSDVMSCVLDAANELITKFKDKEGKHNEI